MLGSGSYFSSVKSDVYFTNDDHQWGSAGEHLFTVHKNLGVGEDLEVLGKMQVDTIESESNQRVDFPDGLKTPGYIQTDMLRSADAVNPAPGNDMYLQYVDHRDDPPPNRGQQVLIYHDLLVGKILEMAVGGRVEFPDGLKTPLWLESDVYRSSTDPGEQLFNYQSAADIKGVHMQQELYSTKDVFFQNAGSATLYGDTGAFTNLEANQWRSIDKQDLFKYESAAGEEGVHF